MIFAMPLPLPADFHAIAAAFAFAILRHIYFRRFLSMRRCFAIRHFR